jgi:hypothetical protein
MSPLSHEILSGHELTPIPMPRARASSKPGAKGETPGVSHNSGPNAHSLSLVALRRRSVRKVEQLNKGAGSGSRPTGRAASPRSVNRRPDLEGERMRNLGS